MKQMTIDEQTNILEAAEAVAENKPEAPKAKVKEDTSSKKAPKEEKKESPYEPKETGTKRFGVSPNSTGNKVLFDLSQAKAISRHIYVHDIHAVNPVVLEERYWVILKDHTHVTLMITEEVFEFIRSKKVHAIFVYNSINEQPHMRQYVIENDDTWPSMKRIDELDAYMDTWPDQKDWTPRQEFKKKEKVAKEAARKKAAEEREKQKLKAKPVDESVEEETEGEFDNHDTEQDNE